MSNPGTDNLNAWWELNEESGTRFDSTPNNLDLADIATVLFGAGKQGNAADFEFDNSEALDRGADDALLSLGNADFTFGCWVKAETLAQTAIIMGKILDAGNQREYYIMWNAGPDRFQLIVSNDGVASIIESADNLGAPSPGTWYFIIAWHDSVANTMNIQVNNGTVDSGAHSTGVFQGSAHFVIGSKDGQFNHWDGLIDEAFFFSDILTADERTWLYNDGSGRSYAEVTAPPPEQDLAVGSFLTTNGSPGATIAITGLNFTPKAILFFWSDIDNNNNVLSRKDLQGWGYSFAVSPTERGGVSVSSDDNNTGTTNDDTRTFNNGVVSSIVKNTGAETGRLDLQSMDNDGFTLVVDDQFPTSSDNMRVNYIAIGDELASGAKVGEFRTDPGIGNQSITGLGFRPEIVFFITGRETGAAALPQADAHVGISFGAAISSSERYVSAIRAENDRNLGSFKSQTKSYSFDAECIAVFDALSDALVLRADFVSMDADGFTINILEAGVRRQVQYLAIGGGEWKLFDAVTLNSVAALPDIDVGFTAEGGMIVSTHNAKNSQDSGSGDGEMSLGAFQDEGTERGAAIMIRDNIDPSQCGSAQNNTKLYTSIAGGFSIDGEMQSNVISDNNLKFEMTNADPAARFFWGFATRVSIIPGAAKGMPIFF